METRGTLAGRLWRRPGRAEGATPADAMLALVARHTPSAIVITDASGRCEWANEALARLTGYPAESMRGRHAWSLLRSAAGDDAATIKDLVRRVARGDNALCEVALRASAGASLFVSIDAQPIRDESGIVTHYMAVLHDVTARRKSENELKRTNEFLAKIIDTAATAIFTIDANRKITNVNAAFCAMTGRFPDEVIGRPCEDALGRECTADECSLFDDPERSGPIYNLETSVITKDGRALTVLKNADLIQGEDGRAVIGVESFVDVTELTRAREQAEAATEAKSRFLANMSHEIRTPMNGIIGMTDLLLETNLDSEQRSLALTSRAAAESLLDVIDDILDFSKVEAGKMLLEKIRFDPAAVVEQALDTVIHRAEQRGLEVIARLDPELPMAVVGDPGRLRQVLLNLLSNAIKFTEAGEIVVRASVSAQHAETRALILRFEVEDSGIGIAENELPGIFEPFTQADSSTTRRFGGTGLGLSISKALTTLMGGEIGATSEPGHGSCFAFTIRVAMPEREALVTLPALDVAHAPRALVCDPSREGRAALEAWLRHLGLDVVATGSADAALARLRAMSETGGHCDLVLVDLGLPGDSALELGVALRENPEFRAIPRVLVGRIAQLTEADRWRGHGFADYVLRPVKRQALRERVALALGLAQPAVVDEPRRPRVSEARGPCAHLPGRLRVLVAEDNAVNQKVALRTLERLGHHASAVSNGRAAVEAVASGEFDVVLMDCQMPELDGYEATRAIRRLAGAKRGVRIIAMTANAMKGDRERCLSAGMDEYLAKPIRPDALARILALETSRIP